MSTAASITFHPGDGITYSNGAQDADNIVYVGSANTATFNATINASTIYKFAVYAYEANKVYSDSPGTKTMYGCGALLGGNWIPIRGDIVYGTTDFCVMKYAASDSNNVANSQANGIPWVNVTQSFAKNACLNLGSGYHLLTNAEWMTIAAKAANVAENWTGGAVGSGALIKGHSDNSPSSICAADVDDEKAWVNGSSCTGQTQGTLGTDQRRTLALWNSDKIWDLSGNAWQWIDFNNVNSKPTPADNSWQKFGDLVYSGDMPRALLVPTNLQQAWWSDAWSTAEGVGWYRGGSNGTGGAMRRGGSGVADASRSGIFTANLAAESEFAEGFTSFRCAWKP
jgi:hypothetical protein